MYQKRICSQLDLISSLSDVMHLLIIVFITVFASTSSSRPLQRYASASFSPRY